METTMPESFFIIGCSITPGIDTWILCILLGYLFGSIPFGLILTKAAGHGDIRKTGSGNIGATNVLRTGSKYLAATTLLLDASKGAVTVYVSYLIALESVACDDWSTYSTPMMIGALGAILGHCFPVWLKFKGGKGVATAIGALLAAVPFAGLAACAVWLLSAFTFRISSLAALLAMAAVPIVTFFVYDGELAITTLLITALVYLRHKDNIRRLLKGDEPKIGGDKK